MNLQNTIGAVTYINAFSSNQYAMFNGVNLQSSVVASDDTAILTSVFNNTNSKLKRNGVEIVSGNSGTISRTDELFIANDHTNGEYAEFLFYNRALTNIEIEEIEGYLAHKWGLDSELPVSHPYQSPSSKDDGLKLRLQTGL